MELSFKEKSLWVSLALTVVIFGVYFAQAFRVLSDATIPDPTLMVFFIGAVIVFVTIEIVLQAILAIAHRREAEARDDERDKLIVLKSTRNAHYLLTLGVWVTGFSLFFTPSLMTLANALLGAFVLSEVVRFTSELIYYRRGV